MNDSVVDKAIDVDSFGEAAIGRIDGLHFVLPQPSATPPPLLDMFEFMNLAMRRRWRPVWQKALPLPCAKLGSRPPLLAVLGSVLVAQVSKFRLVDAGARTGIAVQVETS